MKKALIFGITGQDGIFLSSYLIKKNYQVYGYYRNLNKKKNLNNKVKLFYSKSLNKKLIFNLLQKITPDEIYYLIGESSSYFSFKNHLKTINTNFTYFTYVINSCIHHNIKPKIFYASSGEIFGSNTRVIDEKTEKKPQNPYALSKHITMIYIKYMRDFYNLNISTGVLFNHDSEYRSNLNFIKKITNYLNANNLKKKLQLGNIDLHRDFGLAKEYVVAMHKINQQKKADDYIIATGKSINLRELINYSFKIKNMNYKNYIQINKGQYSNKEIKFKSVNISKVRKLNWKPKYTIYDLIKKLLTKDKF
jgi:GDPmannose 4,6-dehydratase